MKFGALRFIQLMYNLAAGLILFGTVIATFTTMSGYYGSFVQGMIVLFSGLLMSASVAAFAQLIELLISSHDHLEQINYSLSRRRESAEKRKNSYA